MRRNFGVKPWTYPQPVFIIATYGEDGTPDAMNAAWGGISEHNEISMCLSGGHKTVENIVTEDGELLAQAGVIITDEIADAILELMEENHLMVEKDYIQAKGFVEGAAREAAEEKAANIAIGEPEGKITQVLGAPDKVNTSENASGESKQYVYSGNRYVYTVNGVITGMQNISHQY